VLNIFFKKKTILFYVEIVLSLLGAKKLKLKWYFQVKKKVENHIFSVLKINDTNKSSIEKITRTITHNT
jgi:hypothetical protein